MLIMDLISGGRRKLAPADTTEIIHLNSRLKEF